VRNEQLVATIGDRVLHALFAGGNQARRGLRIGKIDQPLFGRLMIAAGDHAKAAAGALMDMGEPAGVLFLVDQTSPPAGARETVRQPASGVVSSILS
jgi:hypothetical protein